MIISGVHSVVATLERFRGDMRIDTRKGVTLTTRAILNGFSGSTRKAPKHRKIIVRRTQEINPRTGRRRMVTTFAVEKWRDGKPREVVIKNATSISEAKKSRLYTIEHRGLAKKSWWCVGANVKVSGARQVSTSSKAEKYAKQAAVKSRSNLKDKGRDDYQVRICDELSYITRALTNENKIFHNASRWLEEYLKRQAKKNAKKASK